MTNALYSGISRPTQDAEQNAARALQDVGSWEEERLQLQTEVPLCVLLSMAISVFILMLQGTFLLRFWRHI